MFFLLCAGMGNSRSTYAQVSRKVRHWGGRRRNPNCLKSPNLLFFCMLVLQV